MNNINQQNQTLKVLVGVLTVLLLLSGLFANYINIKNWYDGKPKQ